MEKILIGKIVNAVALKGEVKVYTYSNPQRYEEINEIYVENEPHRIEKVRFQGNTVILKLTGIDDRNAAEACKGKNVYIEESELPELPEDTYYIRDLIGMKVVGDDGEIIGTLSDVLQNTAQDVYEVKSESGKNVLIPGVSEFILDIDINERKITVRLPEGLLEL
ncbi:MAG: 16S rRNA processing protein RimM [Firmicutes bacterium]|nr:16S rRNA processing protein RimM [Bacillota bacterium]